MLKPAIVEVDNFVTVRYLSGPASSEPLSVKIYSAARSSPTPAVNAAATVMLLSTLMVIAVGWFFSRRWSRGQQTDATAFTGL